MYLNGVIANTCAVQWNLHGFEEELFKLESASRKKIKNNLACWACVQISFYLQYFVSSLDKIVKSMLLWLKYFTDSIFKNALK